MARSGAAWSGWIMFAAVMMVLIGAFDVLIGLAAIFSDEYFVRAGDQLLLADFTAWGVAMLAWGALLILIGGSLMAGREWARWSAVLAVGLNAIGHAAFLAFPVWNVLIIGLSVVVIFALTVRWEDAQADMRG
jgi:hypothetical protein